MKTYTAENLQVFFKKMRLSEICSNTYVVVYVDKHYVMKYSEKFSKLMQHRGAGVTFDLTFFDNSKVIDFDD